ADGYSWRYGAALFCGNYAKAWRRLNIHDLHGLSAREWQTLAEKLIHVHGKAYNWQPEPKELQKQLAATLKETGAQEARLKIKALVNQLDFVQQGIVLGCPLQTKKFFTK
ncbi:MAG: hypothetical protein D3910_24285, partial [Candidatus Electrothrix sp. ATG2]|nr:hypothetical protein [Candidatus Electrothrix sp. ATG2]